MSNLKNVKLSEVEIEYKKMSNGIRIIKESALHRRLCNITDEISDWIGNHSITETHQ